MKPNSHSDRRALIAMSGGVDSCTAAYLMQQAGYDCTGCTMLLHDRAADTDAADAKALCEMLHMPHFVPDCRAEFHSSVIEKFVRCYLEGRTPNPCLDCNRCLKFGRLLREADALHCEKLVTGHYARIEQAADGTFLLKKGADPAKDQSYVLYMLTQEQLARLRLPLGELTKAETRRIAGENGLVNAKKHDSQDICFIPDGDYAAFLSRWTGKSYPAGDIVDLSGRVLGRHRGLVRYTVGQRRGLGLPMGERVYVVGRDTEKNELIVGPEKALCRKELLAEDFNWLSVPEPRGPIRAAVRTRYHQAERMATAFPLPDGRVRIVFDEPQRAVTPGQAAVLYDGELVLGGGTIRE